MRPSTPIFALLILSGCIQAGTYLDDAPCPCDEADGFVCCAATNTCRPDGACPATDEPPAITLLAIRPDVGLYGETTVATIEGTGFLPGMTVSIGPDQCLELDVVSTTEAECVVPRGLPSVSRVDVSASLETGETALLRGAFRYVLPPFVDVTPTSGLERSFGYGPAAIDWDDDGLLDLFYPNVNEETPSLFLNRGGMSFVSTPLDLQWTESMRVITGDFTSDGRTDLMLGGRNDFFMAVLSRGPEGAWNLANNPIDDPQRGALIGASPGDFDGDGDLDVVGCRNVLDDVTRPVVFLENVGNARFVEAPELVPEHLETSETSPSCNTGALGDFDRDGDADFLTCGEHLALLVNEGGRFIEATEASGLPTELASKGTRGCRNIAWVDFDSDGDLDISWTYGHDGLSVDDSGTAIFENRLGEGATPIFQNVRDLQDDVQALACRPAASDDYPLASLHAGAGGSFWLDADHDGDEDLLVALPSGKCLTPVTLYENYHAQGERRFVASYVPTNGVFAQTSAAVIADLDADGDLDVAVQGWGYGGGDYGVFRNNLMENAGTAVGPRGRHLRVRAPMGTTVEVDLDGGPNGTPDFAPGRGKLLVRTIAPHASGGSEPVAHFGLGEVSGSVWVRKTGGTAVLAVADFDREVELPMD